MPTADSGLSFSDVRNAPLIDAVRDPVGRRRLGATAEWWAFVMLARWLRFDRVTRAEPPDCG